MKIYTEDGAVLQGTLYKSSMPPKAAVVLHGAVGVSHSFYRGFAQWLANTQGIACLTYDYRDFGASRTGAMADSTATLADWGLRDQPAALRALKAALPEAPVWVIGHSLGGLLLGFDRAMAGVARVITLGTGIVHLSDHPWPYRGAAGLFWYAHGPVLVRTMGYLSGKLSGFGADLPAGVYWQWRRWSVRRGGFRADLAKGLPAPDPRLVTAPMKVVAVEDDAVVPPAAVWRLLGQHEGAEKQKLLLRPTDHGLAKIGHLGAFARQNAVVWPHIIA